MIDLDASSFPNMARLMVWGKSNGIDWQTMTPHEFKAKVEEHFKLPAPPPNMPVERWAAKVLEVIDAR